MHMPMPLSVYHRLPLADLIIIHRCILCSLAFGNLHRKEREDTGEVLEFVKKAIHTYYHEEE